ncbi:hypothetical protein SAMN05421505_103221 [Sinosporangium album]|uniref:Uncharacterized protein n=1 Tax=Sinosporangium album TaxID=504805 RepID=A0A1G7TD18_9ACTN|nr:peroxide stress protein YaaA [Sinosporangium album]SDG33206.1 hypothetical protein SAMN05421505_103221 [Sinosporangium album]
MLILLPPSEGKATAEEGPALDLASLSFPFLSDSRERVLSTLVALCRDADEGRARAVLGLSPGQSGEILKNKELLSSPALPAADLYTGVLYDNLGLSRLSPDARGRAERSLLVFSGLWGLLRVNDRVPPYRLSMGVRLPPLGPLASFWRAPVSEALADADGLIVDMRSATYASAWRPKGPAVSVRVLKGGKVVSHMAKATRGEVARSLLVADADPRSPEELAKVLIDLDYDVRLGDPPRPGSAWTLDILLETPAPPDPSALLLLRSCSGPLVPGP